MGIGGTGLSGEYQETFLIFYFLDQISKWQEVQHKTQLDIVDAFTFTTFSRHPYPK